MKRIVLMTVVAAGMLVPSAVLVSSAGATKQPGASSPGQGGQPSGDTNASCSGRPCNSENLPYSNGCNSSSESHNPHCTQPAEPTTPTASAPATATPVTGVAGTKNQGGPNAANAKAAQAAQGGGGNLPFTGLDAVWLALLGAGLLASGLALWARSWLKLPANY
jgi:hypothetical protein